MVHNNRVINLKKLKKIIFGPKGLKQSSKHYSQIQGEMAIKESQSCDFVVWTAAKNDIERVPFDSNYLAKQNACKID